MHYIVVVLDDRKQNMIQVTCLYLYMFFADSPHCHGPSSYVYISTFGSLFIAIGNYKDVELK